MADYPGNCIETCLPLPNPCEIYAKAYNSYISRVVNGATVGYRVGEESYQFAHMSASEHFAFVNEMRDLCKACGGNPAPLKPKRQRASVCFVFGDHRCTLCGGTACGCGS